MSVAEDLHGGHGFEDDIREPFAAFVCDDTTQAALQSLARKRGWPKSEVQRGGLAAALRQLGVVAPPELMVVDLSETDDAKQALGGISELAQGGRVIALGTENDVQTFRAVLDAGAADYLVKPVSTDALEASVVRVESVIPESGAVAKPMGRAIACVGTRGGVGASSLISNLAWLLANERERRVCLVDLDLRFGTLSLGFDVDPSPGLREALEDPERVDDFFVDRAVVKLGERLSILGAEEPLDDTPHVAAQGLPTVLRTLRERYDLVLLDLPRDLLADRVDALEALTDIVLISDLSLAGLRDTNRVLRFLQAQSNKAQVQVVANRAGKGGPDQIEPKEFNRELEGKLGRRIALDAESFAKAALAGKPLGEVAPRSRAMQDLRGLLVDLAGEPRRKRKGLRGLLGKG
jgi:pilus assembly protein CpaE